MLILQFVVATLLLLPLSLHASKDITPLLINEQGFATDSLKNLLILTGIDADDLPTIVEKTQESWIVVRQGKDQIERRDVSDTDNQKANRAAILEIAKDLGVFDASTPSLQSYKYGICLGAFMPSVRDRLFGLVQTWNSGTHFEWLIFLGGERPLRLGSGQPDDFAALCDTSLSPLPFKASWTPENVSEISYLTEYDMMQWVWSQVEIPEDMATALQDRVIFVNASKGAAQRPSHADAYRTWMEVFQPEPGSVLASGSPLFWPYQQLAGQNVLGNQFLLETTAPSANIDNQKVSVVLDTLAKCLFEIQARRISPASSL